MAAVLIFNDVYWFWSFSPVNHSWQKFLNFRILLIHSWEKWPSFNLIALAVQVRHSKSPEGGGIRPLLPVRLELKDERGFLYYCFSWHVLCRMIFSGKWYYQRLTKRNMTKVGGLWYCNQYLLICCFLYRVSQKCEQV